MVSQILTDLLQVVKEVDASMGNELAQKQPAIHRAHVLDD
jgi:hypothetical protein